MPAVVPEAVPEMPIPPTTTDSANFDPRADAFFAHLKGTFRPSMIALAASAYANAQWAEGRATAAGLSATAANDAVGAAEAQVDLAAAEKNLAAGYAAQAAIHANAPRWVPGAYAVEAVRTSTLNRFAYRCTVAVSGNIDPAADPTHWEPLGFTKPVSMAANDMDYSLSNYFYTTVSGSRSFTLSNLAPAGVRCEILLEVWHTSGVFNLPANSWWVEGIQPTFYLNKRHFLLMTTRDGINRYWAALANFGG